MPCDALRICRIGLRRYSRKDNIVGVMRDSLGAPRWFFQPAIPGRNAIKPSGQKLLAEWTPMIARGLENLERFRERLGRPRKPGS